ncbi:uncharacterized protein LOC131015054 [Salvia miltiorrhiza]|uniref:uncharacterized protein LOC131015054 n=1 Tax=Salvia miltiorrhiza TaxID=226208 RepID=UPI0025AD0EDE|nr:uncharacterized protein LOC131015054 [Salvia miltiorrhiza]
MSVAAPGGGSDDGGEDKKWDLFNKFYDQLRSSSDEEEEDDDLDRMNISSGEEDRLPDANAARSRKRGSSPHKFPRKSKSLKKQQTDLPINKSKELEKKEEQIDLIKKHRKQIAKDRIKALFSGASPSRDHRPVPKAPDGDDDHGKDVDMGEMADDSRSEGDT